MKNIYPKNQKFKTRFKKRFKQKWEFKKSLWGYFLLRVIMQGQLSYIHYFRFKLDFKRAVGLFEITNYMFWINSFPHIPITKKPLNSRMGKWKGKRCAWCSSLSRGSIFIEFKNIRYGRILYFFKHLQNKLPFKTLFEHNYPLSNSLIIKKNISTNLNYFNF